MTDNILAAALRSIPAFVVVIGFAGLLWQLLNRVTPFDDNKEIVDNKNYAYLIQRLGLLAALVIPTMAVIPDFDTAHPWWSMFWLAVEVAYVFVAVLVSKFVVDWALLPKIKNIELLLKKNLAIGIVEAAFYIGLGFILKGSLTGSASSNWLSFASSVVFFTLGLAFVVGIFWLHELVTPYNLRDKLKDGSVAAALELGGLLIAMSIVVSVGVAGDFTGWGVGIRDFFVTAAVSVVMLYVARWAIDRLILFGCTVKSIQAEEQTAAAGLLAGVLVLMSTVVSTVVANVL